MSSKQCNEKNMQIGSVNFEPWWTFYLLVAGAILVVVLAIVAIVYGVKYRRVTSVSSVYGGTYF